MSEDATGFPEPTNEPLVVLENVNKHFGDLHVLQDINLTVHKGEVVVVIGPSGSGKSTLLHCLAGLDDLTSGTVMIGDTDLATLSDRALTELRRTKVGFVFQAFNLIPTLTARENIMLPLMLGGSDGDRGWIDRVIDTVGLADRLKHRPSELSGGQQQRVAVARALASRPTIIFADEPTGNLDSNSGAEILQFMRAAILTEIGRRYPAAGVENLRFIGPDVPSWKWGRRAVPGRGPRDTYG